MDGFSQWAPIERTPGKATDQGGERTLVPRHASLFGFIASLTVIRQGRVLLLANPRTLLARHTSPPIQSKRPRHDEAVCTGGDSDGLKPLDMEKSALNLSPLGLKPEASTRGQCLGQQCSRGGRVVFILSELNLYERLAS